MLKSFVSTLALSVIMLGTSLATPSWGIYGPQEESPPSRNRRIAHSLQEMEKFINSFTLTVKVHFLNSLNAAAAVTPQKIREQQEDYEQFDTTFKMMLESPVEGMGMKVTFDPTINCYTSKIAPWFPLDLTCQDLQSMETFTAAFCFKEDHREWIQGYPYDLIFTKEEVGSASGYRYLFNKAIVETLTELFAKYRLPDNTSRGCNLL